MEITRGIQAAPVKAVFYGTEGIGKTTLASKAPNPLFIDFEGGTTRINVARLSVQTFSELEAVMGNLNKDTQGFQTLVFDTADWLEKVMMRHICDEHTKKGIEDFGYGKGFTFLAEKWSSFLDRLTRFQARTGVHIIFLAHATMRKIELPEETGAFDKWELKLSKQTSPILKEWADLLLFLNYKTIVVDKKAQGGQRIIYTEHSAVWDAKNRFGLKPELKLDYSEIASVFTAPAPKNEPKPEVKPEPAKPAEPPKQEEKKEPVQQEVTLDPEKEALLEQIKKLCGESEITVDALRAEVARIGAATADMRPSQYNIETLRRIVGKWATISSNIKVTTTK